MYGGFRHRIEKVMAETIMPLAPIVKTEAGNDDGTTAESISGVHNFSRLHRRMAKAVPVPAIPGPIITIVRSAPTICFAAWRAVNLLIVSTSPP